MWQKLWVLSWFHLNIHLSKELGFLDPNPLKFKVVELNQFTNIFLYKELPMPTGSGPVTTFVVHVNGIVPPIIVSKVKFVRPPLYGCLDVAKYGWWILSFGVDNLIFLDVVNLPACHVFVGQLSFSYLCRVVSMPL